LRGYEPLTNKPFFNEFAVRCPLAPARLNAYLRENGIIGGLDISNGDGHKMLFAFTEMNSRAQIDKLIESLDKDGS